MSAMLTAAMLAANLSGSYACAVDRQIIINEAGVNEPNAQVRFEGVGQGDWRFGIRVSGTETPSVAIAWPANPVNIAGTFRAMTLAPGQIAFAAGSRGPCMFTEQACVSVFELSAHDDGSAAFSILPAGSVNDHALGSRRIFHVILMGSCQPRRASE
jgi:hypothetical protein